MLSQHEPSMANPPLSTDVPWRAKFLKAGKREEKTTPMLEVQDTGCNWLYVGL